MRSDIAPVDAEATVSPAPELTTPQAGVSAAPAAAEAPQSDLTPLPTTISFAPASASIDPMLGGTIIAADGNLAVLIDPSRPDATLHVSALSIAPIETFDGMPAPTGVLRLSPIAFSVSALDAQGSPISQPVSVRLRITRGLADAVAGDFNKLAIGYLDDQRIWQTVPTDARADGLLSAQLPQPGLVAVFRLATTFWVVPTSDAELRANATDEGDLTSISAASPLEVVSAQDGLYLVRTIDGRTGWIDNSLVTSTASPDALPVTARAFTD